MDQTIKTAVATFRSGYSGWARGDCPVCITRKGTPDNKSSLSYNTNSGYYQCWRCGVRGFLDEKVTLRSAPKLPGSGTPGALPEFISLSDPEAQRSPATQPALQYLAARGVTLEIQKWAGIGVCLTGKYNGRVILPHRDKTGVWWGFSARTYCGAQQRYTYPPGMVRTGRLYNEHVLQDETDRPALLMEGVFDTLRYCGDAVASLGKPDQSHLPLLLAAKRPVAICLDDDAIGWAMGVLLRLQTKKDIGCVQLPSGVDPADIEPQELLDAADRAVRNRMILVL